MKATVDGVAYEGTEDEIRRIVENPPNRPPMVIHHVGPCVHDPTAAPPDFQRNWDGSPRLTCGAGAATGGTVGTAGEDPK